MPPILENLDPRILRTRRMLKEALLALMEERDFENITVQDIADRATINRATFYAHFQDSFALLAYAIRDEFETVLEKRIPGKEPLKEGCVREMLLAVGEFLDDLANKCTGETSCKPCEAFVEAQVKEVLRELLIPWLTTRVDSQQVELRATLLSWSIYAAAWEWLQRRRPDGSLAQCAEDALPVILAGLD